MSNFHVSFDFNTSSIMKIVIFIEIVLRSSVVASQCSTVVRNTVARATIKVNGKHPILGTRRPETL